MKRYSKIFVIFLVAFCATSCVLIPELKFWLTKINVTSDNGINNGSIVTCHVVACYNDAVAAEFRDMSARDYFVNKEKLLKKYSEEVQVVAKIFVRPGKSQEDINVKLKSYSKAKGLFFYAKYKTSGEFAISLGKEPIITVHLKESEITQYPGPVMAAKLIGQSSAS